MWNNEDPPPRNNEQNRRGRIISFGANVSDSNIQNLTNIEHLDNLVISEQHEHIHEHHNHIEQHQHNHIEQHVHHQHNRFELHQYHNEQHHNHHHHHTEHHQHVSVNISRNITPAVENIRMFNEARFSEHFRKTKCTYSDLFRKGRPITNDMYINTPILLKSTFEELKMKRANQETQEGTTKISEAFPISDEEESTNRLVAVIGEAGAGKTVLLKTLQSYYINEGFFAFLLDFSKLALLKDSMPFSNILKNSCPNFLFDDSSTFDVWLNENEKRCLLLLDGLDMAPSLIMDNVPTVNIISLATVSTWLSLLLSGDIMKDSKIIFSSRPSSVHQLSIAQRPDLLYTMNGFSDGSIGCVIGKYNNQHKDEIVNFIKNKGSNVVSYARNPFVLSMISLIYKNSSPSISSETTMTELYTLAFKQLRCSIHNRSSDRLRIKTEILVDQFFYQIFKEGKISFTEEDVLKHGLTMELLENFSWINVSSISHSDLIEPKEKIIAPVHQSLMEYQVSRHLIRSMKIPEFINLVQTQIYKLEEQDRWSMVRRFTSGLVNTGEFDERKCGIFVERFVSELKSSTSENLFEKHSYQVREVTQASLLQANLYNDLMELGEKLNFIKTFFIEASDLKLQVLIKDATSIEGPIFFLKHIDPQLIDLIITLPDDLERIHFTRFATAIDNLSNKIGGIDIRYISPFRGHENELYRIFNKTDSSLTLFYNEQVEDHDIEVIKNKFQLHIDDMEDTKTFIELIHRGRCHLIRHHSYTSMTSPVVKPSHYGHEKLTINLNGIINDETFAQVVKPRKLCSWDFIISHENEVNNLVELLIRVQTVLIEIIMIMVPMDINWNHVRTFCITINKLDQKVSHVALYNLVRSEVGCKDISLLILRVENTLKLCYSEDTTEVEIFQWRNKLQHFVHSMSPSLELSIGFGNRTIIRLPHTRVLEISSVNSQ